MIEVVCANCGISFDKKATEVRRSEKGSGKHYCSLSCSGTKTPLVMDQEYAGQYSENLVANNRLDEYSPFRHHLSRTKQRKHEVSITVEDLKTVWDAQDGICPLTGWNLYLAPTSKWDGVRCTPKSASLDRIDSSLGYVPGNVRWISVMANYAKAAWTDEEVIEFGVAVCQRNTNGGVLHS